FFFQAEDGIRDFHVTGVQTCALPISRSPGTPRGRTRPSAARANAAPPAGNGGFSCRSQVRCRKKFYHHPGGAVVRNQKRPLGSRQPRVGLAPWALVCLMGLVGAGALAGAFAGAASAQAQAVTPEEVYERLFTSDAVQPEWFTDMFLAELSPAVMDAMIGQYRAALGAYVAAEGTAPFFRLEFERGFVDSQIFLDSAGRIAGIWFGAPEPKASELDAVLADFQTLPG